MKEDLGHPLIVLQDWDIDWEEVTKYVSLISDEHQDALREQLAEEEKEDETGREAECPICGGL